MDKILFKCGDLENFDLEMPYFEFILDNPIK